MSATTTRGGRPSYDVVVVGGGPAGLSAALYLARSRRRVLVVDAGHPRNAPSPMAHGVFTRDGTPPSHLLEEARRQLATYDSAELTRGTVVAAAREESSFDVRLADGTRVRARRLLLATGIEDVLPPVAGLAERWGSGVLHCAYCHGYEVRDAPLALYARGPAAVGSVATLRQVSADLVLATDGPAELSPDERDLLRERRIPVIEQRLVQVSGEAPGITLHFDDGSTLVRRALFMSVPKRLASTLPVELGCALADERRLQVDANWETTVPGIYAAGDMAAQRDQVAIAAASGAEAAMTLNGSLVREDFGLAALPACATTSSSPASPSPA